MKKLIICDSYYQLIVAIQLKLTIFKDCSVDLWISDHSANAKAVANRLKVLNLFNRVEFKMTKEFVYQKSNIKNILDIFKYNFGSRELVKIDLYDEIIFYSLNMIIFAILDLYEKRKHQCIWSRMEEGLFSYETDFVSGNRVNITRKLRKWISRIDVAELVENYYCFLPELKETNREWNFIQIPSFKNTMRDLRTILNKIFDYKTEVINEKYIFFASSSDVDGNSFGETEWVLSLSEKIGKENLIVKTHPRDTSETYTKAGLRVIKQASIPWEVVHLNLENEKHIFLSVNSGAFINVAALLEDGTKGYFLYPMILDKSEWHENRSNEIKQMIKKLHGNNMGKNIAIVDDVEARIK